MNKLSRMVDALSSDRAVTLVMLGVIALCVFVAWWHGRLW